MEGKVASLARPCNFPAHRSDKQAMVWADCGNALRLL